MEDAGMLHFCYQRSRIRQMPELPPLLLVKYCQADLTLQSKGMTPHNFARFTGLGCVDVY